MARLEGLPIGQVSERWPELYELLRGYEREVRQSRRHALEESVQCRICGASLHVLSTHLVRFHGISTRRYLNDYPGAQLSSPHFRAIHVDMFIDSYGSGHWTAERVVAAIRRDTRRRGRPPREKEWRRAARPYKFGTSPPERPTSMRVRDLFGSWVAGLVAAGVGLGDYGKKPEPRKRCRRGHDLTKPEAVYEYAYSDGRAGTVRRCRRCAIIDQRIRRRRPDSKEVGGASREAA
jgi:hypothetical protein